MNGLTLVLGVYGLQLMVAVVLILLGVFIFDKRFKHQDGNDVPNGFVATDEVNIDPVTQIKTRVYYDELTGERFYKEE